MNEQIKNKIEISGVKKSFGLKNVLKNINLSVKEGESLVVIGGSGTGKSVLLKSILGIITPDDGSIMVDGQETIGMPVKSRDELMSKSGMLFQGAALFDSLSIVDNVSFGLIHGQKIDKTDAYEIAMEKIKQVGLSPDIASLLPSEISGGMQKRVGLARAVASNPEIIFFDEPTTGLDPIMADVINNLIVDCVKDLGATTLSITHDMSSVRKIADKVAMIYQGEIIWHGTVDELDDSGNPYVEQFINGNAQGPIISQI